MGSGKQDLILSKTLLCGPALGGDGAVGYMCSQGSETRSQLSWREGFPSGDRGEMQAGVGDEHGRAWKVWEVRGGGG